MERIPIETLREMWRKGGVWGDWRRRLREGYAPGERYFEFGLMPERHHGCHYRVVLNHHVPVWLCPAGSTFRSIYVIRPQNERAGEVEIREADRKAGVHYHTFFVTEEAYAGMLADAAHIFALYEDEDSVCFWSIPHKWFGETGLIRFISEKIAATDEFRDLDLGRESWYWP